MTQADAIRTARASGATLEALRDSTGLSLGTLSAMCRDLPAVRPGRRGTPPEVKARVLADIRAGLGDRAIARAHGVSTGTVWQWRRAA
jgi:transposase-like protein